MLNRLYIVVGVLAIMAVAAAFFVPRFVQWGDYRDRMELLASEVIGAPVTIAGEIEFSLLPQPQLIFADLRVGDPEEPVATIASVQAQFSLVDFLRDRYAITQLVLDRPEIRARIDVDGRMSARLGAIGTAESSASVASARIAGGSVSLLDERSGQTFALHEIAGELRIEAFRGPLSFQGTATRDGVAYRGRVQTSAIAENGDTQLSLLLAPLDESYVVSAEGFLAGGETPSFDGTLNWRRAPPPQANSTREEDVGRGPLVVTGRVFASPTRVLLSDYTIVPDENRPSTRLTGAADVTLGVGQTFNAVISGGIVALPPRAGTADPGTLPYEIVRLLGELPPPPIPGLPGTVGIDIAEVNLRAIALRNLRVDATSDGRLWQVDLVSAQLPGGGSVHLEGRLESVAGQPEFDGDVRLVVPRLDALAHLWRPASETGALAGVPAALDARISLVGRTLSLSDGSVYVGGAHHAFAAEVGIGPVSRHLHLSANLGPMDAAQGAALLALLPDVAGSGQFGATFARARFDLTATRLPFNEVTADDIEARGTWEGGVLALDRLAGDFGGVGFDGALTVFGTVLQPELSGSVSISIAEPGAPGLRRLYATLATPVPLQEWLARSLPADLQVGLDPPAGDGGQSVHAAGRAGAADFKLDADVDAGFLRLFSGPISARLDMHSADPAAFTAQLGLGHISLTPAGEAARLVAVVDGNLANSFATTVRIEGGTDSLGFSGNVVVGPRGVVGGGGAVQISLSDPRALGGALGAGGVGLPPMNGAVRLEFEGADLIRASQIAVNSGGQRATGALSFARQGSVASIAGSLQLGTIEAAALLAIAREPLTTRSTAEPLDAAPFDLGAAARTTTGRIEIAAERIGIGEAGGGFAIDKPTFVLAWDATSTRLREFAGRIGEGRLTAELGVCCAGGLAQKELSGRVSLSDVEVGDLLPAPAGAAIAGRVTGGARFSGTGETFAQALSVMTGEGSFTLDDLSIEGMSPTAFDAVTSLEEVLGLEPDAVAARVIEALGSGRFVAWAVHGAFTIAGGVLRSPNLAIDGIDARLFGGVTLRLPDLGLGGGFNMSPLKPSGPGGMLTEANAQIVASLAGTLQHPRNVLDVTGVVDTLMVSAYEVELARLERMREEDEARQAAAAAERRRIAEEEAARQAAEAARRAAEEEERSAPQPVPEAPSGVVLQPGYNLGDPSQF